jgi:valyl-tRNA synthetase
MVSPYPVPEEVLEDAEAERLMTAIKKITSSVRNVRVERGFTPRDRFKLFINTENTRDANFFSEYGYLLTELARLTELVVNGNAPAEAHHDVIEGFAISIEIPEKKVSEEQIQRTQREIAKSWPRSKQSSPTRNSCRMRRRRWWNRRRHDTPSCGRGSRN